MTFSGRLSDTDLQNLTLSRRKLLGNFVVIGAALSLPESQPEFSYPKPEFKIGDLVAEDWAGDDDEDTPDSGTDFGQVLGVRYLLEAQSCFAAKTWVYYVCWTHSTWGSDSSYPCYDGEASRECDLRLVKQS